MNSKKISFYFSIVLMLSMVLAACQSTQSTPSAAPEAPAAPQEAASEEQPAEVASEPITVPVWFHSGKGEERDVLDAQVKAFNESQSEYVVDAILLPEGTYNDQVNAAALANDLPCLLDFDGPFLYNYAWAGYLMPIDDYLSAEVKDDFLPSIINQGSYAGKLFSLGTFDSGLAIWGNKAYLDKAGVRIPAGIADAWTKEEFMDALVKLQALEEVEYAIDFKFNYGAGEWFTYGFSPILESFGGDLINRTDYQSADGVLNSPEAVEGMTFFQDLFTNGYAISQPAGDDDFYGSKITALSLVGHWMLGPHTEGLGDGWVLIPMPNFGEKAVTGMGSWNWGITSSCETPDGAWAFLDYLIQPDQILMMTNANGAVPARKSAIAQSENYSENGKLNLFVQQLENGVAVERPATAAYPVITAAFTEAIANIVTGADVKTELDKAVATIDQDIADNGGYQAPQ